MTIRVRMPQGWVEVGTPARPLRMLTPDGWRTYAGGSGVPLKVCRPDGSWLTVATEGSIPPPLLTLYDFGTFLDGAGTATRHVVDTLTDIEFSADLGFQAHSSADREDAGPYPYSYPLTAYHTWSEMDLTLSEEFLYDQGANGWEQAQLTFTFVGHPNLSHGPGPGPFIEPDVPGWDWEAATVDLTTPITASPGTVPVTTTQWISAPFTVPRVDTLSFRLDPSMAPDPPIGLAPVYFGPGGKYEYVFTCATVTLQLLV